MAPIASPTSFRSNAKSSAAGGGSRRVAVADADDDEEIDDDDDEEEEDIAMDDLVDDDEEEDGDDEGRNTGGRPRPARFEPLLGPSQDMRIDKILGHRERSVCNLCQFDFPMAKYVR
jgi:hypothetical protein